MSWKPYSERDGIEELRKKVEHYYRACCSMNQEIIATVARSLCYEHSNEYGWNVGDHTAETLVEELVECNELNEEIIAEATIEAEKALLPLLGYTQNDAGEWRDSMGKFPRVGGLVEMIKLLGTVRAMGNILDPLTPTSPPVP